MMRGDLFKRDHFIQKVHNPVHDPVFDIEKMPMGSPGYHPSSSVHICRHAEILQALRSLHMLGLKFRRLLQLAAILVFHVL